MKLKSKKNRPLTSVERHRQVILTLQQQLGVAETQYAQQKQQRAQLQLEQCLLSGCCEALQVLQRQLDPTSGTGSEAYDCEAGKWLGSSLHVEQAALLQQLQQLPLDDAQQANDLSSKSVGRSGARSLLHSSSRDAAAATSAQHGTSSSSSSELLQQQAPTPIADEFPFKLGHTPEPCSNEAGCPASKIPPLAPLHFVMLPSGVPDTPTASATPAAAADSTQLQHPGRPMVLLQYLLSLPPWPAAAEMTLQQLSECYTRCVEDVALALHLLQQPDRPGLNTVPPLPRLQCTITRCGCVMPAMACLLMPKYVPLALGSLQEVAAAAVLIRHAGCCVASSVICHHRCCRMHPPSAADRLLPLLLLLLLQVLLAALQPAAAAP
jgi:hypothetical protein